MNVDSDQDGTGRSGAAATPIFVAGRVIHPTPVFETYWRFAAERQQTFCRRLCGLPSPWTSDPVIREHRFTNAFRAADRVSQYLISDVLYRGSQEADEVVFRTLLFKLFNKIDTWETASLGFRHAILGRLQLRGIGRVLTAARGRGSTLYSAAYVVPPPRLGERSKAENHLRLLQLVMTDGLVDSVIGARRFEDVYRVLVAYPSVGRFIGFQLAIDLNYSHTSRASTRWTS